MLNLETQKWNDNDDKILELRKKGQLVVLILV